MSEYDRQLGARAMPESSDKLITIFNGIRDAACVPKVHDVLKPGLLIVMVARFSQQKDQTSLITAVAVLKKQQISCQVTFVGEGPELVRNKKLVADLQLNEAVQFLGLRLDVANIMACHDVLVF